MNIPPKPCYRRRHQAMSTEHADIIDHEAPAELTSSISDVIPVRYPAPGGPAQPAPASDTVLPEAISGIPGRAETRRRPLLRRVHTLDSMRYRDFRRLWAANFSLSAAAWLQELVVVWLTFDQTASPFLTAMAVGLVTLPYLFAAPLGGLLSDRWDRKKLIATAGIYQALVTSAFASLLIFDALQTWHIFVYILAIGVSWAMSEPARVAAVPDVVPKRELMNAFALNSLAFNSTRLFVPGIAGLLILWVGPGQTLLFGAALYLVASLTAMGMRVRPCQSTEGGTSKSVRMLVEAARYLFSEPIVLMVMGLSTLQLIIVMPFVQGLLPVYAAEVFEMGPAGLGMLMSSLGAGAAVSTITLATLGEVARKGRFLLVAMSANLLAMVALSQSGGMLPPILVLMVLGGSMAVQFSVGGSIVLGMTPVSLRGRVSALSMVTLGLFPIGALVAGGLAELLGASGATLLGAGAMIITLAALRRRLARLWQLNDIEV